MSIRHFLWLSALSEYVQPAALAAAALGQDVWPPNQKKQRNALQFVAKSLCNVITTDRRYPNEVRQHLPGGGHLVMDLLRRRCALDDADVNDLGIVHRLSDWLDTQLDESGIRSGRISEARVELSYTSAEHTYLASGRVWEMHYSVRSAIRSGQQTFFATTPDCKAAVPYGIGAIALW